ncbi:hypothetical protein OG279_37880 (plasmid) [Streptomyces sp. NBC_01201]|nr:hypothetical protein OG279_37880 [Streptomyces sp. NBC_01201]
MAGELITPYLGLLAPWKPVIVSVGGLAWMVAAWMLAPSPDTADDADVDEDVEEQDEEQDEEVEADRGAALLWHVVRAAADAESAGRAGLHLDTVLDSAAEAGLIPQGTELTEFRAWVESCGLPTADKVGMRIGGKPVTRVGMKLVAVTDALGMTPTALLQARPETPSVGAPAQPVGQTPAEAPAETPVPAVLRLIPGGIKDPSGTAPLTLSKERAQEAR